MASRKDIIQGVLEDVYGKGFLAAAMAETADKRWNDRGYAEVGGGRDEMAVYFWMNASGGNTAFDAADKVRRAVEANNA